ncbi:MAG: IgGFc-binding protein [Tannerellaceae bacterium]|jgi:hypothetical protein|nr:IgGFc-binding protein [Tannerellaceae bacterium]
MTLPNCVTKALAGAQLQLFLLFRRIAPRIILFLCFYTLFALSSQAQDTEFWFVAPHMEDRNQPGYPADRPALNRPAYLIVSNATRQDAHVEITLYNGGATKTYSPTISPNSLYKLDFWEADSIRQIENPRGSAGSVVKFGTHIHSDVKVTAYYMVDSYGSKEIYTLKGHQALGDRFYVPIQSDNLAKSNGAVGNFNGYDQVDIVATEDGTTVTVVPRARVRLATEKPAALSRRNAHCPYAQQRGDP